jgi:hypothetical protein
VTFGQLVEKSFITNVKISRKVKRIHDRDNMLI